MEENTKNLKKVIVVLVCCIVVLVIGIGVSIIHNMSTKTDELSDQLAEVSNSDNDNFDLSNESNDNNSSTDNSDLIYLDYGPELADGYEPELEVSIVDLESNPEEYAGKTFKFWDSSVRGIDQIPILEITPNTYLDEYFEDSYKGYCYGYICTTYVGDYELFSEFDLTKDYEQLYKMDDATVMYLGYNTTTDLPTFKLLDYESISEDNNYYVENSDNISNNNSDLAYIDDSGNEDLLSLVSSDISYYADKRYGFRSIKVDGFADINLTKVESYSYYIDIMCHYSNLRYYKGFECSSDAGTFELCNFDDDFISVPTSNCIIDNATVFFVGYNHDKNVPIFKLIAYDSLSETYNLGGLDAPENQKLPVGPTNINTEVLNEMKRYPQNYEIKTFIFDEAVIQERNANINTGQMAPKNVDLYIKNHYGSSNGLSKCIYCNSAYGDFVLFNAENCVDFQLFDYDVFTDLRVVYLGYDIYSGMPVFETFGHFYVQ